MIPQVQIPDFVGTLQRQQALSQQGEMSRLQMLALQQQQADDNALRGTLAEVAPQLGTAEGDARLTLLARLAGAGPRGAQMALPMLQQERDRAEFARLLGGAMPEAAGGMPAAAPAMVPASMPAPAPAVPALPQGAPVDGPSDPRARVQEAARRREAILSDASLSPQEQAARLAEVSAWLAQPSVPERPGGYRANPGAPEAGQPFAGLPAPSGVVPAVMPGGAQPRATPATVTGAQPPMPRQAGGIAGLPSVQVLNRLLASGNPQAIRYAQSVLPLVVREVTQQTGLQPIEGTDAQGNTVLMFADGRGGVTQAQLPQGVTVNPSTREIRTGTEVITVNRAGVEIGRRPINNEGQARDTARGRELGQTEGTQIANAPQALQTADQTIALIDGVLNHRALTAGTGLSGRVLNQIPGTPTYDFAQRVEQLQGRTFLQAFESLKGGGAITEVEGAKAQQAIARLSTAQSANDFRTALRELRDVVEAARNRARTRAPQEQPAQAAPAAAGAPIGQTGMTAEPPAGGGGWSIRPVQ